MPTVLRVGPYRFFFYSNERGEPPHVHVQRDAGLAKVWLDPPALVSSRRMKPRDLSRILRLVHSHRQRLEEAWHEHFGGFGGSPGA